MVLALVVVVTVVVIVRIWFGRDVVGENDRFATAFGWSRGW